MNKIAIIVVSGILIAGLFFVVLTQKPKNPVLNNLSYPTKTTSSESQPKTYFNESGFNFEYPESLTLSEKEVTDESTYAWIELTNPQNKDIISIKLEDSDLTEIDDWFTASNKKDIKGEIKETKLADIDGRQFTDKENQLTTLALDQGGVLISIIGNPSSAHEQIVSSFIFTQTAQTTTDTSDSSYDSGGEDIIFEGEEVIE